MSKKSRRMADAVIEERFKVAAAGGGMIDKEDSTKGLDKDGRLRIFPFDIAILSVGALEEAGFKITAPKSTVERARYKAHKVYCNGCGHSHCKVGSELWDRALESEGEE